MSAIDLRHRVLCALACALPACTGDAPSLSEESLLSYASRAYDASAYGDRRGLGSLDGVEVVVDFLCGDVCPDNTVRIIHFDLEPGPQCMEVGGIEKAVIVPMAIAAVERTFCFPEVLTENWDSYVM